MIYGYDQGGKLTFHEWNIITILTSLAISKKKINLLDDEDTEKNRQSSRCLAIYYVWTLTLL